MEIKMSEINEIDKKISDREIAFKEYCKNYDIKKLQIGSGRNYLEGWFNTDFNLYKNVYYQNLTEKFPFPDDTFDFIYSEHNIEHFTIDEGVFILKECHRVLKSNGKIRIATPDLKRLIQYYENNSEINNKYTNWEFNSFIKKNTQIDICTKSLIINNFYKCWGHKLIYDFELLKKVLEYSGFVDVTEVELSKSSDSELCNSEQHLKNIENGEYNKIETMCVEGRKSEIVIMDFIEKLKSALPEEINFDDLYELAPADLWKTDPRKAGVIALERADIFDTDAYLREYNDVRDAHINSIEHYINKGIDENRLFLRKNKKNKYAILFSISNSYAFALCNVLMSLAKNSPKCVKNCDIIIYSDDLTKNNKKVIRKINSNCKFYKIATSEEDEDFIKNHTLPKFLLEYPAVKTRWGIWNLFKLAAYTFLKEYEKILILDADLYINKDIGDIFNLEHPFAWRQVHHINYTEEFKKLRIYKKNNRKLALCSGGVVLITNEINNICSVLAAFKLFRRITINKQIQAIDEIIHTWIAYEYNIPVKILDNRWNDFDLKKIKDTKIIHFWNPEIVPWKNKETLRLFPGWYTNYKATIDLGIDNTPFLR